MAQAEAPLMIGEDEQAYAVIKPHIRTRVAGSQGVHRPTDQLRQDFPNGAGNHGGSRRCAVIVRGWVASRILVPSARSSPRERSRRRKTVPCSSARGSFFSRLAA